MLDKNILEGLFRQHYGKMFHLAKTLLSNDAEAQDVVQDVFARRILTNKVLTNKVVARGDFW